MGFRERIYKVWSVKWKKAWEDAVTEEEEKEMLLELIDLTKKECKKQ